MTKRSISSIGISTKSRSSIYILVQTRLAWWRLSTISSQPFTKEPMSTSLINQSRLLKKILISLPKNLSKASKSHGRLITASSASLGFFREGPASHICFHPTLSTSLTFELTVISFWSKCVKLSSFTWRFLLTKSAQSGEKKRVQMQSKSYSLALDG